MLTRILIMLALVAGSVAAAVPAHAALGLQVFITTPTNTVITLDVDSSDLIENVRQKIQDNTGAPPAQQVLFFGTIRLEDGRTVADYSIGQGAAIRLVYLPSTGVGMQLFVRDPNGGATITLDVFASDSTENIKTRIQDKLGYPPTAQKIYYRGTLMGDGYTLTDYNVQNEVFLDLTIAVPLTWTDAVIAPFAAGADYSDRVSAARQFALPVYTVTTGALPAGITLDPSGTLSGRPTASGPYSFTITATRDDGLTIDQLFTGSVAARAALAATGDNSILPISIALCVLLLGVALRVRRRA